MAIDVTTERIIPFQAAPRHVPGSRPHISTLQRWRLRGARGKKLETLLVGGRRFTSVEAIHRFLTIDDSPTDALAEGATKPTADSLVEGATKPTADSQASDFQRRAQGAGEILRDHGL